MRTTIDMIERDIARYTRYLENYNLPPADREYLQSKVANLKMKRDQYYNGKTEDYDLMNIITYKEVTK